MLEIVLPNPKSRWHKSLEYISYEEPFYTNDSGKIAVKELLGCVRCEHCGTFWYMDGHPGTSPCIHLQEISRLAGYDMTLGEVVGAE